MGVLSVSGGEYTLHGSELRIPRSSDAEYTVEYSYRPEPLSYDNLGESLGVDPCLYEAAALLTAYYVWLDDDAQKAKNYRAEYDAAIKEILKRRQVEVSGVVTNGSSYGLKVFGTSAGQASKLLITGNTVFPQTDRSIGEKSSYGSDYRYSIVELGAGAVVSNALSIGEDGYEIGSVYHRGGEGGA